MPGGIAMAYWLISSGTSEEPHDRDDWQDRRRAWIEQYGEARMFSRRPRMAPGDILVSYAVGSATAFGEGRIFAIDEVASGPEPSPHERWPWQVRFRHVRGVPSLKTAPTLSDIAVSSASIRRHSHIRLTGEQGERAEHLIR